MKSFAKPPLPDIDITPVLQKTPIQASAPVRVDFGGSWDLKGPALMACGLPPVSINAALDMRTTVRLLPHTPGMIKVSAENFPETECPLDAVDLTSPLALVLSVLLHFRASGVHVVIESESPPESGLGGSGTLAVAMIGAVSEAVSKITHAPVLSPVETVRLAHDIEDSLNISLTGMQDQASAGIGGVNLRQWDYRRPHEPFRQTPLLPEQYGRELSEHMLIACIERRPAAHGPSITWQELEGFLTGTTRRKWYALHRACMDFSKALSERNWTDTALHLKHGTALRLTITPQMAQPGSLDMIRAAEECGCGAAFAGDGKSALWALGPRKHIKRLRKRWQKLFESSVKGTFLDCEIDFTGLRLD